MTRDWEDMPLSVLYDVMTEVATQLGAQYTCLARDADRAGDRQAAEFWDDAAARLRHERQEADPDDRGAIVSAIERFVYTTDPVDMTRRSCNPPGSTAARIPATK